MERFRKSITNLLKFLIIKNIPFGLVFCPQIHIIFFYKNENLKKNVYGHQKVGITCN